MMVKDRRYNGEGQTTQWRRTDDTMEKDRQHNGEGQTIQWRRTDNTMAKRITTNKDNVHAYVYVKKHLCKPR
jgi:hypothetical protein